MTRVIRKLVLGHVFLGRIAAAQTLQYSVHLQDYGWRPETLPLAHRERSSNQTTHLAFDGSGRLFVGVSLQGDAKLVRPGEPNNIFRVLILDSQTGKDESSHDYPTQSTERVGLNLTEKGNLVVTANDKVQLIGEDGIPKRTFDIPIPTKDNLIHGISVLESPSGKTLLLQIDWNTSYFLATDSLSLIAHCDGHPESHFRDVPEAFSDNIQLHFDSSKIGFNRLWAAPLCGSPTVLWNYGMKIFEPVLLDDSTALEIGTPLEDGNASTFEARKVSGEILWDDELPKHFLTATIPGGSVRVSKDGFHFAEEDFELRGGSRVLDIDSKAKSIWVRVYDAQTGKQLGLVPVAKPGIREFALSPDGRRVATLSLDGGTLEVWRIAGEN
jgi:WD40 repeat protein